jgi:catechol 2,3-dioxygenase-like lactoylglutathione lyase family enzyme
MQVGTVYERGPGMKRWVARGLALASLPTLIIAGPRVAAQPSQPTASSTPAGSIVGPALYVSDVNRSLKFYTDGLGMQVRMRFGPPGREDMVLGFGPDPSQPSIMLLSDKTATPRKVQQTHGFDRIALLVPDLPGLAARLRALGFAPSGIRDAHGTHLVMMVSDPDGYRFELLAPKLTK